MKTDWSDVHTNQGVPRIACNHWKLEVSRKNPHPVGRILTQEEFSPFRERERIQPLWHLGVRLLASRIVREYIPVIVSPLLSPKVRLLQAQCKCLPFPAALRTLLSEILAPSCPAGSELTPSYCQC